MIQIDLRHIRSSRRQKISFSAAFTINNGRVQKISLSQKENGWQIMGQSSQECRDKIIDWLSRYFRGDHPLFADITTDLSSFTQEVLSNIAKIPFAKTVTYTELAQMMGVPEKVRAVAQACGRNPLPLFIPCHRVVAKSGLGGFSQSDGALLKEQILLFEEKIALKK